MMSNSSGERHVFIGLLIYKGMEAVAEDRPADSLNDGEWWAGSGKDTCRGHDGGPRKRSSMVEITRIGPKVFRGQW